MNWLYKAFHSGNEAPERIFIPIVRKLELKFQLLKKNNISFVVVIDGQRLPCKKITEEKRNRKREKFQKKAQEYKEENQIEMEAMYNKYSFHLPDDFVYFFIDYLRHQQYDYIVAPFEADA